MGTYFLKSMEFQVWENEKRSGDGWRSQLQNNVKVCNATELLILKMIKMVNLYYIYFTTIKVHCVHKHTQIYTHGSRYNEISNVNALISSQECDIFLVVNVV